MDGGKWHDIVMKCHRDEQPNQPSPPTPPTVGWQKFPGAVVPPNFNKGHIYHYLVETLQAANFDDGDSDIDPDSPSDTFTSKPLHRGELYYTSGHVTDVKDVRSENAYFVMAEVFASMKKVAYTVTVTLSTNSGFVTNATCQCKCAALGRCSHVGGLLHAVLDHASHGDDVCTSQLCQWNVGKRKDKNPGKVTDISYSGASSKRQTDGVILYDPRPSSMREARATAATDFVLDLQSVPLPGPSSWETLLPIIYEDFVLSETESSIIKQQVNAMCDLLTPSSHAPVLLTCEQDTARWANERRVRVTASNAKVICVAKSDARRGNLLKGQLWGESVSTLAMTYGHKHESVARKEFASRFFSKGLKCVETGMWINGQYPGVGASPDGLLFDPHTSSHGILEIKCPMSLKSCTL